MNKTLKAVRTWKRDGSENVMSVAAAVENIHSRAYPSHGKDVVRESKDEIEHKLMNGIVLETPLAEWRLEYR